MLQLIFSRRGGGKTTYCLNQLKAAYDSHQKAAFLIPEQLSLAMEGRVIEKIGFVGGGMEVFSFNRLFQKLYSKGNRRKRKYMDNVGKTMLINRILETGGEDFTIFKPGGASCTGLLSVISEFKRHFASADQLMQAASGFESGLSKRKFTELSLILERFNASLEANRADSTDNLTLLPALIAESDFLSDFSFYIDGFDGFTPQETAVITALAKKCAVFVTLTFDESRPFLFQPIEKTVQRLTDACAALDIPVQKHTLSESFSEPLPPALSHLRTCYGNFSAPAFEGEPNGISVFVSDTPYAEADAVCRRIVHLTKQGMRYQDIFVLVPDLESYLPILEKAFSDHNIPYFADSRKDILHHPLTRLLLSLCDIFITNFSVAAVFSFLKNDLQPIPACEVDYLEYYVLEAGVSGADWKTPWTAAPDSGYDLTRLNQTRQAFLDLISPFRDATKGKTDCAVFADSFLAFLEHIGADKAINQKLKTMPAREVQAETAVWNSVLSVLEQLKTTLGGTMTGIEKVKSALSAGFACCTVGIIPPTCDHVTISTADRSNFLGAKALFLAGVTEGAFPVKSAGSGMITDKERQFLEETGIVLSASNREKALFSPFSVYSTLTVPSRLLCLSYPVAGKSGEGVSPASVLQELKRMFPELKPISELAPSDASVITTPKATLPYFLKRQKKDSLWEQVYGWYLEQKDWNQKINRYLSAKRYTLSWKLSEQMALRLWGKTLHASVSRLEKFAACPLSFFLTYGLKLKERKVHAFTPPEAGNMMHTVMETFVKEAIEQNINWNTLQFEDVKNKTLEICGQVIAAQTALFPSVSKRYAFLLSRIENSTVSAMWAVVHHIQAGIFKPCATEFEFSGDSAPVFQTKQGNTLILTGKIDRIDRSPDGYRIIDYKSGNKDLSLSSVASGRSLQLPIYSYALKNSLGKPKGMFYLTVDSALVARNTAFSGGEPDDKLLKEYKLLGYAVGDETDLLNMDKDMQSYSNVIPAKKLKDKPPVSSRLLTEDEYAKIETMAVKKVQEFGDAILSGDYPILPVEQERTSACTYCTFRSVCRFDPSYCQTVKDTEISDAELLGREEEQNG